MKSFPSLTRRGFLGASGASLLAANRLFGEPADSPKKPNPARRYCIFTTMNCPGAALIMPAKGS